MSVRLGNLGLIRLAEALADRDREVIHSVASHRFMTGKQIEQLHFHHHSTHETGARVARTVLARLTRDRVLRRLERRIGGIRAGSRSYVYTLGPVGRRLVGAHSGRLVREPSAAFLDHILAVVDTHLALVEAERIGALELLWVETEPSAWRRYLNSAGAHETLRPDMYVEVARGPLEFWSFLEVDRGTEYRAALVRKCRAYDTYWRLGIEQQKGTFPRVVWAAPNAERERAIEVAIASARGINRDLFVVTRADELVEAISGGRA
jgi:hypothetical protein